MVLVLVVVIAVVPVAVAVAITIAITVLINSGSSRGGGGSGGGGRGYGGGRSFTVLVKLFLKKNSFLLFLRKNVLRKKRSMCMTFEEMPPFPRSLCTKSPSPTSKLQC